MENIYYSNKVRASELDLQGIVHHSNYLIWAECSRIEFAKKIIGLDIYELGSKKILI